MKRIIWMERFCYPVYIGFCPSPEAWRREMREHHKRDSDLPEYACANSDARTSYFQPTDGKSKQPIVLISLNLKFKARIRRAEPHALALIAHEAVHVWQFICDEIGEESPSKEVSAYAVQMVFANTLKACMDSWFPKRKGS